jgi:hypothetical protein
MIKPWKPTALDLILSAAIAIGFPFLASLLYAETGALLPMILYYGLAWGIVKWRRGSTGYFNKPIQKIPLIFYINVGVILIALILAYLSRITIDQPDIIGILLTAVLWATINASSEQLLWIYIFEAWDLSGIFSKKRHGKLITRAVGLILFTAFVGLIHVMFWVNFLHTVDSIQLVGVFFVIITTVSGYLHLVVWRKSSQMVFTFIPHFMLNLIPLIWTGYSILPYLIK